MYQTDLTILATYADEREEENNTFRGWLKGKDDKILDTTVHEINDVVSAGIDCMACANCCKTLLISVTPEELISCSNHLGLSENDFKDRYLEESLKGNLYINTTPC